MRGRGTSTLLFLAGAAVVGVGAALPYANKIAPEVVRAGQVLGRFGIDSGDLLVAGFVVGVIGLAARAIASAVHAARVDVADSKDSKLSLAVDQLVADVSQVVSNVSLLSREVTAVAESQGRVLRAQAAIHGRLGEMLQSQAASGANENQQEAMFRLAASVDHVNARVDERVTEMEQLVRSRFEALSMTVGEMQARTYDLVVESQKAAERLSTFEQRITTVTGAHQHAEHQRQHEQHQQLQRHHREAPEHTHAAPAFDSNDESEYQECHFAGGFDGDAVEQRQPAAPSTFEEPHAKPILDPVEVEDALDSVLPVEDAPSLISSEPRGDVGFFEAMDRLDAEIEPRHESAPSAAVEEPRAPLSSPERLDALLPDDTIQRAREDHIG